MDFRYFKFNCSITFGERSNTSLHMFKSMSWLAKCVITVPKKVGYERRLVPEEGRGLFSFLFVCYFYLCCNV